MQQILALSRCAVIVRHWFEIDLDVRESVQLMMAYLRRPDLLDEARVAPWRQAA